MENSEINAIENMLICLLTKIGELEKVENKKVFLEDLIFLSESVTQALKTL